MDVNNTKLHVLMGEQDWKPLVNKSNDDSDSTAMYWDDWYQGISLRPRLFAPTADGAPQDFYDRRGCARDRRGHWYWIADNEHEIRRIDGDGTESHLYWSLGAPPEAPEEPVTTSSGSGNGADQPTAQEHVYEAETFRPKPVRAKITPHMRGLTVTEHDFLVVGLPDPGALLVFDLCKEGPPVPAFIRWPMGFSPFDMAPVSGGGVCILEDGVHPKFWVLNRHFRPDRRYYEPKLTEAPQPPVFRPVKGERPPAEAEAPVPTIAPEWAIHLEPNMVPIAIEALSDGSVLILEGDDPKQGARILRYFAKRFTAHVRLRIPGQLLARDINKRRAPSYHVPAYDFAIQPVSDYGVSPLQAIIYVASRVEKETYAYALYADKDRFELKLQLRRLPMSRLGGKGLVATRNGAFYECQEHWLFLTEERQPTFADVGVLVTHPFDGKEANCVWHRLLLDGAIPADSLLKVESRAADDVDALGAAIWRDEPLPYLRPDGAELPYYSPFTADELKRKGTGTWELLLQAATGRYLQLRFKLSGNQHATPRIRAMRLYYPRFSYLVEYLPGVYREDTDSASFLDRFLANVEGIYTSAEGRIAQAQMFLDPRTMPPDYLEWLAAWVGSDLGGGLSAAWDDRRRRLFVAHAPQLFRARGTLRGLVWALRVATDPQPDESIFTDEAANRRYTPASVSWQNCEVFPGPSFYIVESYQERQTGIPAPLDTSPLSADTLEYQDFLRHRYHTVDKLNEQYGTAYDVFEKVPLPATAPGDKTLAPYTDWVEFAAYYLPGMRSAHQFTVYVPAYVLGNGESGGLDPEVVRLVVELEKPAHTHFDLQTYWAMVQVGTARLGSDTFLADGTRLYRLSQDALNENR